MVLKSPSTPVTLTPPKMSLEVDMFGLSYHTNRNYDFNETNPGLGLSFVISSPDKSSWFNVGMAFSVGTYEDSYKDQAKYLLIGPRLTIGYEDSFHVSFSGQAGYLDGSGSNGTIVVPFVTVGYDWISLGVTGDPIGRKSADSGDTSKMIGAFLKFRVWGND